MPIRGRKKIYSSSNRFALAAMLSLAIASSACSLKKDESTSVFVDIPAATSIPARYSLASMLINGEVTLAGSATPATGVDDFSCYGVNVMGPGLARYPLPPMPAGANPATWECRYRGVTSQLVSTNGGTVELKVPAGPDRTIQMVGLKMPDGVNCPVGEDMSAYRERMTSLETSTTRPFLQEIGRTTLNLFGDASVTIQSNFSENRGHPFYCGDMQNTAEIDLPLFKAYAGADPNTALGGVNAPTTLTDSTLVFTAAAGTAFTSNELTSAQLAAIASPSNSTPVQFATSTTGKRARFDLFFDATDLPEALLNSTLTKLQINVAAVGGSKTLSGSCNVAATWITNLVLVRNRSSSTWLGFGPINSTPDPNQNDNAGNAANYPMAYLYQHGTTITYTDGGTQTFTPDLTTFRSSSTYGGDTKKLVHVVVRSGLDASGPTSGHCSQVDLYQAKASIKR